MREATFRVDGKLVHVEVEVDDLGRSWWQCPRCNRRCRYLYEPSLICRQCAGLDWASHLEHSLPSLRVYRIQRWRRSIGIDPQPFAEIPRRQPRYKRYHRIADRIRAEETKLLDHLASVNNDLERRRKALTAKQSRHT
jgi:hypothetical protein